MSSGEMTMDPESWWHVHPSAPGEQPPSQQSVNRRANKAPSSFSASEFLGPSALDKVCTDQSDMFQMRDYQQNDDRVKRLDLKTILPPRIEKYIVIIKVLNLSFFPTHIRKNIGKIMKSPLKAET